jgi:hypothetical protein
VATDDASKRKAPRPRADADAETVGVQHADGRYAAPKRLKLSDAPAATATAAPCVAPTAAAAVSALGAVGALAAAGASTTPAAPESAYARGRKGGGHDAGAVRFRYAEVVRGKEARENLRGFSCHDCQKVRAA